MKEGVLQFGKSLPFNKKALFGAVFLVLLFSFTPLYFAQANIFSDILGALSNIAIILTVGMPLAIITAVLFVGALVAVWLAVLLVAIIKFFIVASLSIPILPGEGIEVVTVGWQFSRDLVNITFILILVFIGLATILRLQNYSLQRALPLLIVIALLVNFSGVFVAFIVDIANLITNVFVAKLGGFNMGVEGSVAIIENAANGIVGIFTDFTGFGSVVVPAVTAAAYLLFYLLFSAVLFIVALLIIVRVGILWALMILAPLAFASYILPITRNLWSQWLKQLIQWSIIGIPIAFFLWLAQVAASAGTDITARFTRILDACQAPGAPAIVKGVRCTLEGADQGLMNVIISLTGPIVALLFVIIGIMVAMQFAPAGANTVIKYGRKWGPALGLAAGSALWRRAEGKDIRQGGGRISRFGAALSERASVLGKAPEGAGFLRRTLAAGARGPGAIARLAGRGIELGSKELTMRTAVKDAREQETATKEVTNKDSFSVFNMVNEELAKGNLANWNRITGLLNGVRARGDGDDIEAAFNTSILPETLLGQAIKTGLRAGPPAYRPLFKSFYARTMLNPRKSGFNADPIKNGAGDVIGFEGPDAGMLNRELKSLPTKFNAQDFQGDTLAKENFDLDGENKEIGQFFVRTIVRERGSDFLAQMGRRPRKEESQKIMQYIFKEGEFAETGLGDDWLLENGAESVLRYIDSPGARSLGIGTGRTRTDIDNTIRQWQQKQTRRDLLEEAARLQARIDSGTVKKPGQLRKQIEDIKASLEDFDASIQDLEKEMAGVEKEIQNIDNIPEKEFTAANAQTKAATQKRIEQIRQVLRGKRASAGRGASTTDLGRAVNEVSEKVRVKEAQTQEVRRVLEATPEQRALDSAYEVAEEAAGGRQQLQQQLAQYQQELQRLQQQEQLLKEYQNLAEYAKRIGEAPKATALEKRQFSQIAGLGAGRPQSIPFASASAGRLQGAPEDELKSGLRKLQGAQRALADTLQERYKELQSLYQQQEQLQQDPTANRAAIANITGQVSDIESKVRQHEARRSQIDEQETRVASEYNQRPKKATGRPEDRRGRAPDIGDAFK